MVNFVTIAVLGPQGLALAAVVVLDDAIGRIQNVGGGTVVLLQADGFGPGKNFFKVQDIFNGSTAELINALISSPTTHTLLEPPASRRTRWNWATLVSWYSSTTT